MDIKQKAGLERQRRKKRFVSQFKKFLTKPIKFINLKNIEKPV